MYKLWSQTRTTGRGPFFIGLSADINIHLAKDFAGKKNLTNSYHIHCGIGKIVRAG
jgi:hypothetical protein